MAPGVEGNRWEAFGLSSLLVQWIMLLTVACTCALQRGFPQLGPAKLSALSAMLALAIAPGTVYVIAMVAPEGAVADRDRFALRTLGITVIVVTLAIVLLRGHFRAQRLASRLKQAELDALQTRIHPHFLFNAINSATSLARGRPAEAESILMGLSDLFRAALAPPGWVPLETELELVRRYLDIEQARFGDKMQVEWVLPADVSPYKVPLLCLQPLVENAVTHGLDDIGRRIARVAVHGDATRLVLRVWNPVASVATPTHGHRIGLAGVRARVENATNGDGSVTWEQADGGFSAVVTLPVRSMAA